MDAPAAPPTYLSDVQVSSRLDVSLIQVRRWAKAGKVPCIILPDDSVLFDPAELAAWLQSLRRGQLVCGVQESARG
jgi:predicted site-specific integrase-resolvase